MCIYPWGTFLRIHAPPFRLTSLAALMHLRAWVLLEQSRAIQVGQIMFSLKVTAVSRQLGGAKQQHFRLTTCHWMCALQLKTVGAGY